MAQDGRVCSPGTGEVAGSSPASVTIKKERLAHYCGLVLERIATTERVTIIIERDTDGKMRATSGSWDGAKVFLRGPQCRRPAARRSQGAPPDEWDPPIPAYGPGESKDFDAITDA
jgi:hypothetical protein